MYSTDEGQSKVDGIAGVMLPTFLATKVVPLAVWIINGLFG